MGCPLPLVSAASGSATAQCWDKSMNKWQFPTLMILCVVVVLTTISNRRSRAGIQRESASEADSVDLKEATISLADDEFLANAEEGDPGQKVYDARDPENLDEAHDSRNMAAALFIVLRGGNIVIEPFGEERMIIGKQNAIEFIRFCDFVHSRPSARGSIFFTRAPANGLLAGVVPTTVVSRLVRPDGVAGFLKEDSGKHSRCIVPQRALHAEPCPELSLIRYLKMRRDSSLDIFTYAHPVKVSYMDHSGALCVSFLSLSDYHQLQLLAPTISWRAPQFRISLSGIVVACFVVVTTTGILLLLPIYILRLRTRPRLGNNGTSN